MSSLPKPTLRLDWCSYEAARYACEKWHYSKKMPAGKLTRVGVWEAGRFIGAIIFSSSATPWLGSPYGLSQFQACELVRVALAAHAAHVSRIVQIAIRLLRGQAPGLRMIVSYADPEHGHSGGIYQAMGWTYVGLSSPKWTANGQHNRAFGTSVKRARRAYGPNVSIVMHAAKHKYIYALDATMQMQIAPLAQPYPKRATSIVADASPDQGEEGGAEPTVALHTDKN